jgi:hypothetical protein
MSVGAVLDAEEHVLEDAKDVPALVIQLALDNAPLDAVILVSCNVM